MGNGVGFYSYSVGVDDVLVYFSLGCRYAPKGFNKKLII